MKREVLAGTNYVLRPIYDDVVDELGVPPLGYPKECQFHWPEKPLAVRTQSSSGRYVYVGDKTKLEGDMPEDVTVIEVKHAE